MSVTWLIAFVVFLVVESMTASLTSIWFAGGALAALVAQVCGAPLRPQLAVFVIVSFILFIMVRPFTARYLHRKKTDTNVDSFAGRKAVVKERIDNEAGTGTAILAGETWLARAAVEGETFEPNTVVVITSVSGAKLMVKAAQPEHRVEQPKEE
ncbi:NfeD family protein [Enterocloster citroniae]|uniref:NfeD family protein n=1 Tax=Enterocloster citroniae TaxID=358743 RepID=UPI001D06E326|nr:NfeD family protein [Enterocloster citroniae]MBS1484619.1 NfeD family protein [Clostridium sp.]MCB7063503.1 NfeD family protein [Enterocloster citroniae]